MAVHHRPIFLPCVLYLHLKHMVTKAPYKRCNLVNMYAYTVMRAWLLALLEANGLYPLSAAKVLTSQYQEKIHLALLTVGDVAISWSSA